MSLTDLRNNELTIVRKQWLLHHQSSLSGQFLLPAAALSYCSQQWRIMTAEHNNDGLFSCLLCPLCLSLFSTHWSRLISFSRLLVAYLDPNDTLTAQSRIVGTKLFKQRVRPLMIANLRASLIRIFMYTQTEYKGGCWYHFLSVLISLNEFFFSFK